MQRISRLLVFIGYLLAASSALAQSPSAPGINHPAAARIPERMHQFVEDKTIAGVVTLVARSNDIVEFDAQAWRTSRPPIPCAKTPSFRSCP